MRLGARDTLLGLLPWGAACLVIACIVHIVSVLAMPRLAPRDSFARLAAVGPANRMTVLAQAEPGREVVPFIDPAFSFAVCPFDLAGGPVGVTALATDDTFLALSFHDRQSRVFYALTDRAATKGKIDIVVATAAQVDALEAQDNEDEPPSELRLTAPERQGYVLVRVLKEPGRTARDVEASLQAVRCAASK